jgi:hypothetical protein
VSLANGPNWRATRAPWSITSTRVPAGVSLTTSPAIDKPSFKRAAGSRSDRDRSLIRRPASAPMQRHNTTLRCRRSRHAWTESFAPLDECGGRPRCWDGAGRSGLGPWPGLPARRASPGYQSADTAGRSQPSPPARVFPTAHRDPPGQTPSVPHRALRRGCAELLPAWLAPVPSSRQSRNRPARVTRRRPGAFEQVTGLTNHFGELRAPTLWTRDAPDRRSRPARARTQLA